MHPIRKNLRRFEIPGHARSLTFSCLHRLPLLDEDARSIIAEQIARSRSHLGFTLYAWVVMPEHVHLLIKPASDSAAVPRILSAIKRRAATRVLEAQRNTGNPGARRLWQPGGGYDRNISSRSGLLESIEYIHLNPVRRGLAGRPEDWAWSSARAAKKMHTAWPAIDQP